MDITLSSEKITDLAKSMVAVQRELVPALKDGINSYTNSSYATLKSVMEVCRNVLLSHGIWMTQYPISADPGHLGLVTKIVHVSTGQWQSSFIHMPLPKNDPQGYGSAITYARRYGLSALVGIISEEDDDGQGAMLGEEKAGEQDEQYAQKRKPFQLPRLDGVNYKTRKGGNGKEILIAYGNTHTKKEFLKSSGFKWDRQERIWWRSAYG